ncbi:hypothetical protein A3L12_08160 [Thermococcus sp. P6]|uniref:NAD(P)H-hydrate dehydratase n=1 Tax=Thermococcus sp. P6 TaxID=122420 RepID=UPI000B5985F5|nr:hypothetical protein A3L12_08160 [Thermococcus sp. P6]
MRIEDVYIWDINARWLGVTPYQLMENAGAGVARTIEERFGKNLRIAVFSGTGNNGGDGFVAYDIISDGKTWKYSRTGNRGMTTGGTGDVLAGLVGSLLAFGNEPLRAASVGAFLNGLSGDMVKGGLGENFTALEVARRVPRAVKWVLEF